MQSLISFQIQSMISVLERFESYLEHLAEDVDFLLKIIKLWMPMSSAYPHHHQYSALQMESRIGKWLAEMLTHPLIINTHDMEKDIFVVIFVEMQRIHTFSQGISTEWT